MRIQPHVWAANSLHSDEFLEDVVANSVCTHGHPRAIIGACFHALTLAYSIESGALPPPDLCLAFAARLRSTYDVINGNQSLGATWRPLWEHETGTTLAAAWELTVQELESAIEVAAEASASSLDVQDEHYHRALVDLGLLLPEGRGSGLLTPVAAVALGWCLPSPEQAVRCAANSLGSDTDTIATMAGALIGATDGEHRLPTPPLDEPMIVAETHRLIGVANGQRPASHAYPDLLTWSAPRTQADALATEDGHLAVAGLGSVTALPPEPVAAKQGDFAWQWVRTGGGQTLLIKRRSTLPELDPRNAIHHPRAQSDETDGRQRESQPRRQEGMSITTADRRLEVPLDRGVDLGTALDWVETRIEEDQALGYTLRRIARDGSVDQLIAFVAALRQRLRQ